MDKDSNFTPTGYGDYQHNSNGQSYGTANGQAPNSGSTVYRNNSDGSQTRGTVDGSGNFKPW